MNLGCTFKIQPIFLTLAVLLSTPVYSINLDELMEEPTNSPANTPTPSRSTSGFLLDNVEQERSTIKQQALLKEYKQLQPEINSQCQCLRNNSCEKRWGSTNWNKSRGLLVKQRKGLNTIRKVCTSLKPIRQHMPLEQIKSKLAHANTSLKY